MRALAGFLTSLFSGVRRSIQRHLIGRILSGERQRYRQTLKAASFGMTRIRNLSRLLNLIARVIVSNVRVSHAIIFLKNKEGSAFTAVATRGKPKKAAGELPLEETTHLAALLEQQRQPVVYRELKAQLARNRKAKDPKEAALLKYAAWEMENLQAALCIPSFIHGKFQGFLVVGEKLSGQRYDPDDLSVFSALASQAALAIENAQAYEELRDTRDQLLRSERMGTIGKFAADMAHEIKNPLQAVLGFFEMLPEKYDDPDFRNRFSKLAQTEAERINDLVRQLMIYAKPRSPELAPIEISQAIESVLALLENDLLKYRIEIRRGYSPNGLTVEADRDQMKQVFLNLFSNAIDAMGARPDQENQLDIVAYPDGENLVVKIRDTGPGIGENQLPLIFAPFFTTKEKGSGLGLAIVQNILRAHNAAIRAESATGAGTTFVITFPGRQSELPASESPKSSVISVKPQATPRGGRSAASILLVDPEEETLENERITFEARGITCWMASDGPSAMELLKQHQPDLVLSEILLKSETVTGSAPDGFMVLREAKKLYPEKPVFLITSCDLPEYRDKAKELGADGYLVKPINQAELLSILPGP